MQLGTLPSNPLVSVLVGNYNYEAYLQETIESVVSQTYRNWELIICDDGSTDRSVDVIQRYVARDQRIRLIRKENGGHPSSLNAAYAACSGDLICLLDSDDLYLPEKLERIVQLSSGEPDAGLLVHRVIRVNGQRRRQGVWPLSDLPRGWYGQTMMESGGVLPYLPPTSGLSLRRPVADRLFPLRTEPPFRMSPDQIVMRLAPLFTRIVALPEALSEYRLHGSNTYSKGKVTVESIGKEMTLSKALWEEQTRFLSKVDHRLAAHFHPIEKTPYWTLLAYLDAKLRLTPDLRRRHTEYLAQCSRCGETKWLSFWRISIVLPQSVFRFAINLLLGQNILKQLVARLRRLA